MATLFVLYGSATGNAEHIAKDLTSTVKSSSRNKFQSVVCHEGDQFKKKCQTIWETEPSSDAKRHGLIVVTSTTGNGDAPENISRFVRYLKRRTTPTTAFQHLSFAVLGLGDTNYDQFCESGKLVDKRLGELGGTRAMPLACADEATGLEDTVEPWTDKILDEIQKSCFSTTTTTEDGKADETSTVKEVSSEQSLQLPGSRPNLPRHGIPPAAASSLAPATQPNVNQLPGARPGIPIAALNRMNASIATTKQQQTSTKTNDSTIPTETNVKSSTPLFIMYGSATGNAEHIAKDLELKYNARSNNFFPKVICCEADKFKKLCQSTWESDPSPQKKHGLIIVVSTTGNGDPPENASRFMRFLKRKTTPVTSFQHVAFAVLGLGDTNYDQFCCTGKAVDKRLAELGGIRAKELGCADEATGLEDVVDPWVTSVFDDIERSCRSDTLTTSIDATSSKVEEMEEAEEEKKVENDEISSNKNNTSSSMSIDSITSNTTVISVGVNLIRKLLEIPDKSAIPSVANCKLPSIGSSLSSCELVHESENPENYSRESRGMSLSEFDRMTVSTTSSSGIHYTMAAPYESTIIGARYLTNTEPTGATMAYEALLKTAVVDDKTHEEKIHDALQILEKSFPLVPPKELRDEEYLNKYECNGKRVIEMELSLPEDFTLEYQPGDSIGLLVTNAHKDVKFVLNLLKTNCDIKPEQVITVSGSATPITVEKAMFENVDLSSPIKSKRIPLFLSQLADKDTDEQKVLRLLSSKTSEGEALYKTFIEDQRKSIIDLLHDFPSCAANLTLENILSVLPCIAPRYYSISSSPLANKTKDVLSLTVSFSVVDYLTPSMKTLKSSINLDNSRRKGGLATRYLEALCSPHLSGQSIADPNTHKFTIKVFPKPTAEFFLPKSLFTPLILIGPGTGVAPFMGFLSHRRAEIAALDTTNAAKVASEGTWRGGYDFEEDDLQITKKDARGLVIGADYRGNKEQLDIDLFFGCRHKTHDWLYREEMLQLKEEGILNNLNTAFSRDSEKKMYVQDLMKSPKCSERVVEMIVEKNASVYVCGDGNAMGKDVQNAIIDIVAKYYLDTCNEEEAFEKSKDYFSTMKEKKRFLMDIWS